MAPQGGHLLLRPSLVINLPPLTASCTPPPCSSHLGLLFSLGPLLCSYSFLIQTLQCFSFSVSVSKNITPQSPPFTVTPATESKPDWNQLWLAQLTQHKSDVCQLFKLFDILISCILYIVFELISLQKQRFFILYLRFGILFLLLWDVVC